MKAEELSTNAFGMLIRSFREQRKWSQAQLAQAWGHTREYVSLIERGERKLDKQEHVYHLADILGIPPERLDAVGKGEARRQTRAEQPVVADEVLLQALLEPMLTTTKLSWLAWLAMGQQVPVADHLASLRKRLEKAFTNYRGSFLKPAQEILAYAYDIEGQIAFDQLKFAEANEHFQDMLDLGEEIMEPNIIALAQIRRADVLRKRGRYEPVARMLAALFPTIKLTEDSTRGPYYQILARTHAQFGVEQLFLEAIGNAENIARNMKESLDTQYNQFNLVEVLQERARGYTMLGQAEKALAIYTQTDKMQPFRPMRSMGSYVILKAQAHAYSGDTNTGIDLALQGLKLARTYHSPRHISRVQDMYDRLRVTALSEHACMQELKEGLMQKLDPITPETFPPPSFQG